MARPFPRTYAGPGLVAVFAAAALLAVALSNEPVPSAAAASPPQGQEPAAVVAPGQPVTWQGARFTDALAPAAEACTSATCETFEFQVEVPPGYWDERRGGLEVTVRWSDFHDNDFELYLYDAADALVAQSAGPFTAAESLRLPAVASGAYRALVVAALVEDAAYEGLAEIEGTPMGGDPVDLLPDLVAAPPYDLRLVAPVAMFSGEPLDVAGLRPLSCNPDETAEEGVTRCLRFSSLIANLGHGDLEFAYLVDGAAPGLLDPEERRLVQRVHRSDGSYAERLAGRYEVHATHAHFHYENFVAHTVYRVLPGGDLEPATEGRKSGFCTFDMEFPGWLAPGTGPRTYRFEGCLLPTERTAQGAWRVSGITVGWADVYTWDLPDQYVDASGLADGCYRLVSAFDPGGTLLELDPANNVAHADFRLRGDEVLPGPCA